MNGRKARALRKSLSMSPENHRQKDYKVVNEVVRPVYFRGPTGELLPPQFVKKTVLVNTNLNYYRKQKKIISRGYLNE